MLDKHRVKMKKTFRGNRFDLNWPLSAHDNRGNSITGSVLNIGVSGYRFTTLHRFRLRDETETTITLGTGAEIGCTVKIVWMNSPQPGSYEFGARFTEISEADHQALLDALSIEVQNRVSALGTLQSGKLQGEMSESSTFPKAA